jgi:hypothetical protein
MRNSRFCSHFDTDNEHTSVTKSIELYMKIDYKNTPKIMYVYNNLRISQ